jgi:hypothetical protein
MNHDEIRIKCLKLASDITMSDDPGEICAYADTLFNYVRSGIYPARRSKPITAAPLDIDDELDDDEDDDRDFAFGSGFTGTQS